MDVPEFVLASITEATSYARASERLRAAIMALGVPVQGIQDVIELEPDLGPEMGAATQGLQEVLDALGRASDFLDARFDERRSRLAQALGEAS